MANVQSIFPKISVIIPVYNAENTIERCIESVLCQTYKNYEVIIIDDGSQDNSGRICDGFAESNIKVFHQENQGVSAARNQGIQVASGEFLMFLDADDYLMENCLDILVQVPADLIIGSIAYNYGNGRVVNQVEREDLLVERNEFSSILPSLLDESRLNYPHAKLYSRRILSENNLFFEDYLNTYSEDTIFTFNYLLYCRNLYISGKVVSHYCPGPDGLGRQFKKDRYQKNQKLNFFLEEICKKMNIYNDQMKLIIDKRRVQSAAWNIESILVTDTLKKSEKIELLDHIKNDGNLPSYKRFDVEGKENLIYLMENGSRRLINNYYREMYFREARLMIKGQISKLRK